MSAASRSDSSSQEGKPAIISAAITGSIATPDDHPGLPVSADEIVESAVDAAAAGAAIVHIHVREPDGTPSASERLYQEVFDGIRALSDVNICATTGSGNGLFSEDERLTALRCGPDLASFDAGSMNFGERAFLNTPQFLKRLAKAITSQGIFPEIECFDVGMIGNALRLQDEGLLPGPAGRWWFQFCLGVRGGAPADPRVIGLMRELIPSEAEWSVVGVGRAQRTVAEIALENGGHVRTGLEDNLYRRRGEYANSNAELVEQIVEMAAQVGRPVASPSQTRVILGLDSAEV